MSAPTASHQYARRAVIVPALLAAAMMAYLAVRQPVLFGADERAHLLYTASIIDGHLPEYGTDHGANARLPIIAESLPGAGDTRPRTLGVFEAYHPPLAYVVASPVVWAANAVGSDSAPAVAMRLMSVAAMAIGVAFAGLFAEELFPRRWAIGFAAACLTAVVPTLVAVGAAGQNDGLAFAMSTCALWLAAWLLRRGPSPRLLAAACGVAAAGMLTRVSLAPFVLLMAAAAALAEWRTRSGPSARARVAVRAVGAGAAVALAPVVAAGWFYWRNHVLYDSWAGLGSLPQESHRIHALHPTSLTDVLTTAGFYRTMAVGLYGSLNPYQVFTHRPLLLAALVVVLVAGMVLAALRRRPPAERAGIGPGGWALVLAVTVGIVVSAAWHASNGGGVNPRYLVGVIPIVSALLARAVVELPAPRLVLGALVAWLGAVVVWSVARIQSVIDLPGRVHPFDDPPVGHPVRLLLIGAVVAAAVACVAVGARLGPIGADEDGDPTGDRPVEVAVGA